VFGDAFTIKTTQIIEPKGDIRKSNLAATGPTELPTPGSLAGTLVFVLSIFLRKSDGAR
jgi:hypothetical protein